MSTWSDPGNALYWPDTKPFLMQAAGSTATGTQQTFPTVTTYNSPNVTYLYLGIDVVCQDSEPTQINMGFAAVLNTNYFYYDSQSTGEGLGVRFQWRGQLPVQANQNLYVVCITSSGPSCAWTTTVWGLVLPFESA